MARLENDEWYEFTAKAKRQGKIRFTGMSGHSGKLIQCITHAIDNELVDVLLCAYNFGMDPAFYERFISRMDFVTVQHGLPDVLAKAHAKGIGVVVMKTLRGARLNDMRPYEKGGATFAQAALRWTLSSPHVDGLVVSMTSVQKIDEYVGASGGSPAAGADFDLLEEYLLSSRDGYCNHGCEQCHSACPNGVAINEVLRTRMYATDYRDLATAREEYAKLGPGASACANCADQPCLGKCPQHLEVGALTTSAHQMLG